MDGSTDRRIEKMRDRYTGPQMDEWMDGKWKYSESPRHISTVYLNG